MFTLDKDNYFSSSLIDSNKFVAGFGTRDFLNTRNYEKGYEQFQTKDINFSSYVIPEQVHSANITVVTKPAAQFIHPAHTDGLITQLPNCVLAVRTADCLPLLYVDNETGYIGVSHQGWKGVFEELPLKMIQKLESLGSKKQNITIAIGPGIGACCYEIYGTRYEELKDKFQRFGSVFFENHNKHTYLNLLKLTYLQLISYNIKEEQIGWFPFCTACNKDHFFSYQRDGKEEYGEMLSFIVKK